MTTQNALTSTAPACRESAGKTAVSIAWKQAIGGGAIKKANESLVAQVTNNTGVSQQGRIIATGAGLDGRFVERPVGNFNLAAGTTQDVSLPVNTLPIQSEVALSSAALLVELTGPVGAVRPSSTRQIHYIFGGGYSQAEIYTPEEVLTLPNGGLRTADPMDVRGRVLDTLGPAQEINASSAAVGVTPRQGLSRASIAPSNLVSNARGFPELVAKSVNAPAALTDISENIGFRWSVTYTDSGYGEDVWSSPSTTVPAYYAAVLISSVDFQTTYFYNELNAGGATGLIPLPPSTMLYASIFTYVRDPNYTAFSNLIDIGTGPSLLIVTFAFTTRPSYGSQLLTVPFNNEAVQTTALAGRILAVGNGITPGSVFNIYSNTGCPDNGAYNARESCYSGPITSGQASIYFGNQSGGLQTPGTSWKFIVAHEIGHAVQDFASGIPCSSNYTITGTNELCKCTNVSTSAKHCLNSQGPRCIGAKEGFAQFYADKLFNNDTEANATFVNYKEFPNSNTLYDFTRPPQAKDGFGPYPAINSDFEWNIKKCGSTYSTSVEYDWMRFYYNVGSQDSGRASTRTTMTDLFNIYKAACGGHCSSDLTWFTLTNAAQTYYGGVNDQRYIRFNTWGGNEGVNN